MGRKSSRKYYKKAPFKRNKKAIAARTRWNKEKYRNTKEPMIYDDVFLTDEENHLFRNDEGNWSNQEHFTDDRMSEDMCTNYRVDVSGDEFSTMENLKSNPNWCSKTYNSKKQKEVGIISSDECVEIENFELEVEVIPKPPSPISGNRIVELGYVIDRILQLQCNHLVACSHGRLTVKNEKRRGMGLVTSIVLGCIICNEIFELSTEDPSKPVSVINTGTVWGTLATGSTYTHLTEFLSCVDIPSMPVNMFYEAEEKLDQEWKSSLLESMTAAGIKERENALANNEVNEEGVPCITVYVDGSWSKRSYGNNYSSLSGMVGIIGRHTGELLFAAVRNKFCIICYRAEQYNLLPRPHTCYKNWTGSAPAMEADMVVQGFNCSEEMHGVRYNKFIADGDSSVFAKIKEKVTYGADVTKVECTNHALKNYKKHLLKLKNDTQIALSGRKLLTQDKIKKLVKRAKCSIYEHSKQDRNIPILREDLRNGLHHVFGDHCKCRPDICNDRGNQSNNQIPQLQATTMYNHLYGSLNLLVRKADKLIENENNNRAEQLMNIVSRFNMGKRLNLIQRGSYEHRVHLSGLRYNHGNKWHVNPWKKVTQVSPGQHFKKFLNKQNLKMKGKSRRKLFHSTKSTQKNTDYGVNAQQPEEDEDIIRLESEKLIENLQVDVEDRDKIQNSSVGQFGNDIYEANRKHRLTASLFGRVINRKPYTPCHGIVKSCLSKQNFLTEAMKYGITKEKVAIGLFSAKTQLEVMESGLWIDLDYGFLGASPDGLIGEDSVVEVKCLHAAASQVNIKTIEDAIKEKKANFLQKKNSTISLKTNHPYYFQIQGQLNITKREKCYFIVYINDSVDLYIEEIQKNEQLWRTKMLPKLIQFYKECIAPEIIRDNLGKNFKCVDPDFIKQAIQEHDNLKKIQ